jgi:hypothetical protein
MHEIEYAPEIKLPEVISGIATAAGSVEGMPVIAAEKSASASIAVFRFARVGIPDSSKPTEVT